MDKFLRLVEENTPEYDLDAFTQAKNELARALIKVGVNAVPKAGANTITVKLNDKVIVLEVVNVVDSEEEESEDDENAADLIGLTKQAAANGNAKAKQVIDDYAGVEKNVVAAAAKQVQNLKRGIQSAQR